MGKGSGPQQAVKVQVFPDFWQFICGMSLQIGIFMLLHEVASVNIVINCCHSSDSNTCSFGGVIQQFLVSCDTKLIPSHSTLDIQTLERFRLAIFWVEPSKSVSHSWEDSGSLYATHHTHFWWIALNNERYILKKNEDFQFQLIAAIIQAAHNLSLVFCRQKLQFERALRHFYYTFLILDMKLLL